MPLQTIEEAILRRFEKDIKENLLKGKTARRTLLGKLGREAYLAGRFNFDFERRIAQRRSGKDRRADVDEEDEGPFAPEKRVKLRGRRITDQPELRDAGIDEVDRRYTEVEVRSAELSKLIDLFSKHHAFRALRSAGDRLRGRVPAPYPNHITYVREFMRQAKGIGASERFEKE